MVAGPMEDIKQALESFLKREGLSTFVPTYRFQQVFGSPVGAVWFVLMAISGIALGWFSGLDLLAAIIPAITFILLMVVTLFRYIILAARSKLSLPLDEKDASLLGTLFALIWPLSTALAFWLVFSSIRLFVTYVLYSLAAFVLSLLVHSHAASFYRLWEPIKSSLRLLPRAIAILVRALPILIVLVLLTTFSEEYWHVVGQLPMLPIIGIVLLILLPAALLHVATLSNVVQSLIPKDLSWEKMTEVVGNAPFLSRKRAKGLISEEAWTRLINEGAWRHVEFILNRYLPSATRRAKHRLIITLVFTSIFLFVAAAAYFYVLVLLLQSDSQIIADLRTFPFFTLLELAWYSPTVSKVATVTASFLVLAFNASALMDDNYRLLLLGDLESQVTLWLSVAALYEAASSSTYQFLRYVVDDKNLVNAEIVVAPTLSEEEVLESCNEFARHFDKRNLIVITAYRKQADVELYRRGTLHIEKWNYVWNKKRSPMPPTSFRSAILDMNELRYMHEMGFCEAAKRHQEEIEADWFGNTSAGQLIGKAMWTWDKGASVIQHPYVHISNKTISAEISLLKRLASTDAYRELVTNIIEIISSNLDSKREFDVIIVECLYRGRTTEQLASFECLLDLDSVTYQDEYRSTRYEATKAWPILEGLMSTKET